MFPERDIDPFSPVSFELFLLRHDGLLSGAGDFLEGAGDRDTELGVRRPSGDVEDIFVLWLEGGGRLPTWDMGLNFRGLEPWRLGLLSPLELALLPSWRLGLLNPFELALLPSWRLGLLKPLELAFLPSWKLGLLSPLELAFLPSWRLGLLNPCELVLTLCGLELPSRRLELFKPLALTLLRSLEWELGITPPIELGLLCGEYWLFSSGLVFFNCSILGGGLYTFLSLFCSTGFTPEEGILWILVFEFCKWISWVFVPVGTPSSFAILCKSMFSFWESSTTDDGTLGSMSIEKSSQITEISSTGLSQPPHTPHLQEIFKGKLCFSGNIKGNVLYDKKVTVSTPNPPNLRKTRISLLLTSSLTALGFFWFHNNGRRTICLK